MITAGWLQSKLSTRNTKRGNKEDARGGGKWATGWSTGQWSLRSAAAEGGCGTACSGRTDTNALISFLIAGGGDISARAPVVASHGPEGRPRGRLTDLLTTGRPAFSAYGSSSNYSPGDDDIGPAQQDDERTERAAPHRHRRPGSPAGHVGQEASGMRRRIVDAICRPGAALCRPRQSLTSGQHCPPHHRRDFLFALRVPSLLVSRRSPSARAILQTCPTQTDGHKPSTAAAARPSLPPSGTDRASRPGGDGSRGGRQSSTVATGISSGWRLTAKSAKGVDAAPAGRLEEGVLNDVGVAGIWRGCRKSAQSATERHARWAGKNARNDDCSQQHNGPLVNSARIIAQATLGTVRTSGEEAPTEARPTSAAGGCGIYRGPARNNCHPALSVDNNAESVLPFCRLPRGCRAEIAQSPVLHPTRNPKKLPEQLKTLPVARKNSPPPGSGAFHLSRGQRRRQWQQQQQRDNQLAQADATNAVVVEWPAGEPMSSSVDSISRSSSPEQQKTTRARRRLITIRRNKFYNNARGATAIQPLGRPSCARVVRQSPHGRRLRPVGRLRRSCQKWPREKTAARDQRPTTANKGDLSDSPTVVKSPRWRSAPLSELTRQRRRVGGMKTSESPPVCQRKTVTADSQSAASSHHNNNNRPDNQSDRLSPKVYHYCPTRRQVEGDK
uniref:Uncharacterized protein n=1 Tax=Plectus sambesii TaxID=2011161 RepID=A0A914W642_9BILA